MTWVMVWIIVGMELMSKMKPDRIKAGKNVTMMATCPATNWLFATTDIRRPIERAVTRKSEDPAKRTHKEPLKGTRNNHVAMITDSVIPPIPMMK